MNTRKLIRKALLIVALAAPVAALAAAPNIDDRKTVRVSFADLDINSEAGAKVLYSRLKRASRSVCGVKSYQELGSIGQVVAAKECYANKLDQLVSRIDSNALKEIHAN